MAACSFGWDANTMAARAWQVELLRFTFIGLSDESVRTLGSMQCLFGINPETETNKAQQQVRTEEASWRHGRLSLIAQPRRIDVIYSAVPEDAFVLPKAGDFEEVGRELLSMLKLVSGHKVGRIACGGVALHVVSDVDDGYSVLADLLPFVRFESGMREFSMQLNRPKMADGLLVNELGKWSVVTLRLMQFDSAIGSMRGVDAESAVRLEFDINNAEATPVPEGADCFALMSDLFERSLNVLREGSI